MDPTPTVAASQGAIARNLVEFQGHEQATRVDSETGSIRSELRGGCDTESIVQGDVVEVVDATPAEAPVDFARRATQYSESLACLDGVSLRGRVRHQGSCDAFSPVPQSRRGFTRQPESANVHI